MRYRGQDHTVKVRLGDDFGQSGLRQRFEATYHERYGHISPIPVQIVSLRANCQAPLGADLGLADVATTRTSEQRPPDRDVFSLGAGRFVRHAVFARDALPPGWSHPGPCLIEEEATTTNVPEGWTAAVLPGGTLELTRS
jgi:N-methylhydantoinase A/oxoprolinase/acetone carboxylase beta subunit